MLFLVNVDDVSGETIPHVIEGLLQRGASNVHVVQALTKKGRVEYLFFIDGPEERIDLLGGFLVCELGTIGMRVLETRHIRFQYRFKRVRLTAPDGAESAQADVSVKEILNEADQVLAVKAEHQELRSALALFEPIEKGISLAGLKRLVEQTIQGSQDCHYGSIQAHYLPKGHSELAEGCHPESIEGSHPESIEGENNEKDITSTGQ